MNNFIIAGYICASFTPQPDITAYEVAQVVQNITGYTGAHRIQFTPVAWANLPASLKRHFTEGCKQ